MCGGRQHAAWASRFLLIQFSFLFTPGSALERENSRVCLVGEVFGAELLHDTVGESDGARGACAANPGRAPRAALVTLRRQARLALVDEEDDLVLLGIDDGELIVGDEIAAAA